MGPKLPISFSCFLKIFLFVILLLPGCLPHGSSKTAETPTYTVTPSITAETQSYTVDPTLTQNLIQPTELNQSIPAQEDWVDYGIILDAGVEGEWDYYLWGGFAFSILQKDGTYYLYYQGSSDYRTEFDETVLWRSIGVATSQDGIHFVKYEGNPILEWFPNQYGEEGAVSSGVTLGPKGETVLYYGANSQESPTTVNADIRVASSLDGFNFTDLGLALDHKDRSVWGSGDELFPVDAIYESDQWVVFYIPNGTYESGKLGVAYGNQYNSLDHSAKVESGGNLISVWGTASHLRLDSDTYVVTLNNVRTKRTEIRLLSLHSPNKLSEPLAVYQFDEVQQAVLLLDEENGVWFLYYRTHENSYGVKLAPAGETPLPTSVVP